MKDLLALGTLIMFSCVLSCPAPIPEPPGTPITFVQVTVDGNTYDVSAGLTSFNDSASLLQSQVWWGDPSLAEAFTTAVGPSLGVSSQGNDLTGPLFDYAVDSGDLFAYATVDNATAPISFTGDGIGGSSFTFATATLVTAVPESSANPILLAGAGLFAVWRGWRTFRPAMA